MTMIHQPASPITTSNATYELRLYGASQTDKTLVGHANLKCINEIRLAGPYLIDVIDLMKPPQLAAEDQIIAEPTLVGLDIQPLRN